MLITNVDVYDRFDFNRTGYNEDGYDKEGFSKFGLDSESGYDIDG